ncbi:MAG: peptidoglycan-binding domain-containing protein [Terriglobales bacterium]
MMVLRAGKTFRSMILCLGVALLSAGLALGAHASTKTATTKTATTKTATQTRKPAASTASKKKATASKSRKKASSRKSSRRARRGAWKRRGQQAMDQQRTRQIQAALVREKYLTGEPTGMWDERSKQAMMKYQQDNGWQTKVLPDSRALIKLGLGPTYIGINPDSLPAAAHSAPAAKVPVPLPAAGVMTKPQP